jgi:biopolymer transport protein ExbD
MVSFSDIAFLLIIFFILTTTFVRNYGQDLDLPSGTRDTREERDGVTTITISPDELYYNDEEEPVTLKDLRQRLQAQQFAARPADERIVLVESAPSVLCEKYYRVVAAVANAGGVLAMLEEEREGEGK